MYVNPVQRGGQSAISHVRRQLLAANPGFGEAGDVLEHLDQLYTKLNRVFGVSEAIYSGEMRAVDNLINEDAFKALGHITARDLTKALTKDAKAAEADTLDSLLADILSVWFKNDFQSFLAQVIAGHALDELPVALVGFLLSIAREDPITRLKFVVGPKGGVKGDPSQRIHVVGHTHDPDSTTPRLDGLRVQAQHVNTGTGIDIFRADYRWPWWQLCPFKDSRAAADALVPQEKSQACLLVVDRQTAGQSVRVHGVPFRALQGKDPAVTGSVTRRLSFETARWNDVVLD